MICITVKLAELYFTYQSRISLDITTCCHFVVYPYHKEDRCITLKISVTCKRKAEHKYQDFWKTCILNISNSKEKLCLYSKNVTSSPPLAFLYNLEFNLSSSSPYWRASVPLVANCSCPLRRPLLPPSSSRAVCQHRHWHRQDISDYDLSWAAFCSKTQVFYEGAGLLEIDLPKLVLWGKMQNYKRGKQMFSSSRLST